MAYGSIQCDELMVERFQHKPVVMLIGDQYEECYIYQEKRKRLFNYI